MLHHLDHKNNPLKNLRHDGVILKIRDNNILEIYKKVSSIEMCTSFIIPYDFLNDKNDDKCLLLEGRDLGKVFNHKDYDKTSFDNYIRFLNLPEKKEVIIGNNMKNIFYRFELNNIYSGILILS